MDVTRLRKLADTIKNETEIGANSAERIGDTLSEVASIFDAAERDISENNDVIETLSPFVDEKTETRNEYELGGENLPVTGNVGYHFVLIPLVTTNTAYFRDVKSITFGAEFDKETNVTIFVVTYSSNGDGTHTITEGSSYNILLQPNTINHDISYLGISLKSNQVIGFVINEDIQNILKYKSGVKDTILYAYKQIGNYSDGIKSARTTFNYFVLVTDKILNMDSLRDAIGAAPKEDVEGAETIVSDMNNILPAFTINSGAQTPIQSKSNAYITLGGEPKDMKNYSYFVYDVSKLKSINISITNQRTVGVPSWALYSDLVEGFVSSSTETREGEKTNLDVAINVRLEINDGEKYLAIQNRNDALSSIEITSDGYTEKYNGTPLAELDKQVQKIASGETDIQNKVFAILGDSITWLGNDDCSGVRGWTTYFKKALGLKKVRSYARSGATWSHTASTKYDLTENTGNLSDDNVIYNQVNRLIKAVADGTQETPNVIIIAAGTNDAWYPSARPNAVGEDADVVFASEEQIVDADPSTITSIPRAMRYDVEMLENAFPNVKIVIFTPLQSTGFTLERLSLIKEAEQKAAYYLGLPVINQSEITQVSRIREKLAYKYTVDGTHTSEFGAEQNGKVLAARVKSLLEF